MMFPRLFFFQGWRLKNPQPASRESKLNAKNSARISFMI
jgi:hypothetical protein